MHQKRVVTQGKKPEEAEKALIMLHGRGASAEDILTLSEHLAVEDFALVAPQATGNSWYPYSFLAARSANEPWLTSAIDLVAEIVRDLEQAGISKERIYLLGFSQGACLTVEYAARNASQFGGIVVFTGGLIGDDIDPKQYKGDFAGTPVFVGSSDPDIHVPVQRVHETVRILRNMNAQVHERIYNGLGHTINDDEIMHANALVFGSEQ